MPVLTPKPFDDYSVAEQKFIEQKAKQLTVYWAEMCLEFGSMPTDDGSGRGVVYINYAKSKRWISADGTKLLAAGYLVATTFLKR